MEHVSPSGARIDIGVVTVYLRTFLPLRTTLSFVKECFAVVGENAERKERIGTKY